MQTIRIPRAPVELVMCIPKMIQANKTSPIAVLHIQGGGMGQCTGLPPNLDGMMGQELWVHWVFDLVVEFPSSSSVNPMWYQLGIGMLIYS